MALAMAVRSPGIHLVGVTTVAGNVNLAQATKNTLSVLSFLGDVETPVHMGMSGPLARAHVDASHFHGADGLGGADFGIPTKSVGSQTAPEFIVQTARAFEAELTLVFVGPLTNLAVALKLEPRLPELVQRTVVMGGAFEVPGNDSPFAEFNILVDPEAARVVAESNLDVTWIGLDVTHRAGLNRDDWDLLANAEEPSAVLVREVCRASFEQRKRQSVHLHDPMAIAVALDSSLVETSRSAVWVDTSVRETAGMTRMYFDREAAQHEVARGVDGERFRRLVGEILGIEMLD
jgi:purine nucleosidase